MEAVKKRVGRPRKPDTEGNATLVEKRKYMRKYVSEIKKDIFELDKMEQECEKDLAQHKKDKKKLIDELEKANKQAESILKEKVKK